MAGGAVVSGGVTVIDRADVAATLGGLIVLFLGFRLPAALSPATLPEAHPAPRGDAGSAALQSRSSSNCHIP